MSAIPDTRNAFPKPAVPTAVDADGKTLEVAFVGASKRFTYRDIDGKVKQTRQEKASSNFEEGVIIDIDHEPEAQAEPIRYVATLTDAECQDMLQYFTSLAEAQDYKHDEAETKAQQDLQDCLTLAYFTDAERADFTERVALEMSEGRTRREAETTAFFALPLPQAVWEPTPAVVKPSADAPEPQNAPGQEAKTTITAQKSQAGTTIPMQAELQHAPACGQVLQGADALRYVTHRGIKLIGRYKSNAAIASKDDYHAAFTNDFTDILGLMSGQGDKQGRAKGQAIVRFDFIPADYGLLCLDIDRNHADGIDGLLNFEQFLDRIGKPRNLRPPELRDIEGGSFPCYVSTPSGGYHLYFKYTGTHIHSVLVKNVEIKTAQCLTAPGSFKDGKPYVLHGNFGTAPLLYGFIETRLPKPTTSAEPHFTPLSKKKFEGATAWGKIVEWTDTDGQGGSGRNEWAYSAALHAKTHDWNQSDTLEALRSEPRIEGLPETEIISAVNSAWRKQ